MYRTLRLCSGRGAFEAIPDPPLRLDLNDARARLEASGATVTDARVLLIIRLEHEVSLSRDGRILVKTPDRAAADRVFHQIVQLLGLAKSSSAQRSTVEKRRAVERLSHRAE